MTIILGIEYCIILGGLVFLAGWALNAGMTRLSPKWAARRKLREGRRHNRASVKRQKKRAAKAERDDRRTERERKWAEAHPNDPAAKLILAQEVSPAPLRAATPLEKEEDFLAELRRKQQADDEYRRQREARRIAEAMRAEQLLEWVIENPSIPEARRHLEEQLEEMVRQLESTDREISHCNTMMSLMKGDDDPETILYAMRRSEAEAKKAVEVERIRRIQSTLEMPLSTREEQ